MARIFFERRDLAASPRFRVGWMDRDFGRPDSAAGDTVPPMDILETETGVEIIVDLPGMEAADVAVTFRDGTVLVAGRKRPQRCQHGHAAFHLAERGFGRFSRALKLNGAFDASRAVASLAAGELRIVLPRLEERRGLEIRIAIAGR